MDIDPTPRRGADAALLGFILILCGTPGFRRAGIAHPARAAYPLGYFSPADLILLQGEPRLAVQVIEGVPVPSNLRTDLFASPAPLPKPSLEALERAEAAGHGIVVGSADAGVLAQAARDLAAQAPSSPAVLADPLSPAQMAVTDRMAGAAVEAAVAEVASAAVGETARAEEAAAVAEAVVTDAAAEAARAGEAVAEAAADLPGSEQAVSPASRRRAGR